MFDKMTGFSRRIRTAGKPFAIRRNPILGGQVRIIVTKLQALQEAFLSAVEVAVERLIGGRSRLL